MMTVLGHFMDISHHRTKHSKDISFYKKGHWKGYRAYIEKLSMVIATNLASTICCVYKEKIVKKTTYIEERSVHTNSESCNIQLGSKKSI